MTCIHTKKLDHNYALTSVDKCKYC